MLWSLTHTCHTLTCDKPGCPACKVRVQDPIEWQFPFTLGYRSGKDKATRWRCRTLVTVKMCWGHLERGGRHYSGVSGWRGSSVCRAAFPGWSAQDSAMAVDHDHEPLARAGGLESVPSVPCGCCRGSQKEEDWSLHPTLGARC